MGAEAPGSFSPSYRPDIFTLAELEQLATEGKDVAIEDVVVLKDGTFSYKNNLVVVYIRDIQKFQNWVSRFHIADCKTLQRQQQLNGLAHYVVTTRNDGSFVVDVIGNDGQVTRKTMKLNVCQNCLDKLRFGEFSLFLPRQRRMMIVSRFEIQRFFARFPRSLLSARPAGDADTAPIYNYSANFDDVSTRVRERRGWKCECCRRDFSPPTDRKYLHVHHRNGIKNENHDGNLQALCLGCHADEPAATPMNRNMLT